MPVFWTRAISRVTYLGAPCPLPSTTHPQCYLHNVTGSEHSPCRDYYTVRSPPLGIPGRCSISNNGQALTPHSSLMRLGTVCTPILQMKKRRRKEANQPAPDQTVPGRGPGFEVVSQSLAPEPVRSTLLSRCRGRLG